MTNNRQMSSRCARCLLIILFTFDVASQSAAVGQDYVGVVENLKECGGDYSGYRYIVTSPNYPEAYPEKQSCVYRLRGSPLARCDQTLNLEFLDFSLSPSENCLEDYVEIGEGGGGGGGDLLCGRVAGIRTYTSGENGLVARFHGGHETRPVHSRRRFKITVTALPCTPGQINEKERAKKTKSLANRGNIRNIDLARAVENNRLAMGPSSSSEKSGKVERSKFFGDPTKVEIPTANDSTISSYLFVPASETTVKSMPIASTSERIYPDNARVAPPASSIFPPSRRNAVFREASRLYTDKKLAPLRAPIGLVGGGRCCYGVAADQPPYSGEIPAIEEQLGGSLDGGLDCGPKNNLPNLEVTANFRQTKPPPSIDYGDSDGKFGVAYYPATNYGVPPNRQDGSKPWLSSLHFLPPKAFNVYQAPHSPPPSPPSPPSPRLPAYLNPNARKITKLCCNSYFSGLRFVLTSPGFLSVDYNGDAYECVYSIIPYSLDICRMRFNFKFFNHGTEDYSCSNGYVEIDGRRFCGCKRGLSVTSIVTSAFPKILPVLYTGYPRSKFNGFSIEVFQESCSNGYPPYSILRSKKDVGPWTNGDTNVTLGTISGSDGSPRPKRNSGYIYSKPNIGLIESPALWNFAITPEGRQASNEMSGNLFSPLLTCQTLSFIDWTIAAKEAYLRNARCARTNPLAPDYPGYRPNDWINYGGLVGEEYRDHGPIPATNHSAIPPSTRLKIPSTIECEDVNVSEGIISSPGYPNEYPDNLSKCFRFYKAPDSCQLEVVILDFDVENSVGCTKDYVTFGERNGRYCGRSLAGAKTLFDISRSNNIPKVCFVSDAFGSGPGFSVGFSQIPCRR